MSWKWRPTHHSTGPARKAAQAGEFKRQARSAVCGRLGTMKEQGSVVHRDPQILGGTLVFVGTRVPVSRYSTILRQVLLTSSSMTSQPLLVFMRRTEKVRVVTVGELFPGLRGLQQTASDLWAACPTLRGARFQACPHETSS
jgi:hypothetical protein